MSVQNVRITYGPLKREGSPRPLMPGQHTLSVLGITIPNGWVGTEFVQSIVDRTDRGRKVVVKKIPVTVDFCRKIEDAVRRKHGESLASLHFQFNVSDPSPQAPPAYGGITFGGLPEEKPAKVESAGNGGKK